MSFGNFSDFVILNLNVSNCSLNRCTNKTQYKADFDFDFQKLSQFCFKPSVDQALAVLRLKGERGKAEF